MGKRKDNEARAASPSDEAETPPPGAKDASPETQIALELIESLKSEPAKAEPPLVESPPLAMENPAPLAEMPAPHDAPRLVEPFKPIELPKPESVTSEARPSAAEAPSAVEPAAVPQPPRSRFALLAASVAAAAAIGAMTGALAVGAIAWIGSSPAPAPASPMAGIDLSALHDTISKMRSEIAALRAGVDTGARSSNAQFAKVAERFDRLERVTAEHTKLAAKGEVTGSVAPRPSSATPEPPPRPNVVDGWVLRNVSRGVAYIQGRRMGVIEVERGDIVPGLGRIESIRRQDGHWVVVTAKGLILPPR